jgi:non-specific protein-tyrosine kinase
VSIEHGELVTLANPRSPVAEAYRSLRTNIQLSSLDRPIKTLLVTSPGTIEGKSSTVANLAVAFAQGGNRTLLVDCDLRRPSLHALFGASNERGLTTMLVGEDATPPIVDTGVEGLSLLPSGPQAPNPSEILGSKRFQALMERLAERSDLVLFDAPPALAVSDAIVLSRQVDGVVLVVTAGKTKRDHASRAKQQLERAGAKVLGVVLNNARVDQSVFGYYA